MYWVISLYRFFVVDDPQKEIELHKKYFSLTDVKGRIYICKDGINAQISATPDEGQKYIDWLQKEREWKDIFPKIQTFPEHAFFKLQIKLRPLVAFNEGIDLQKRGIALSPSEWKEKIANLSDKRICIDARNNYESTVGHFKGALLPDCVTFRDFSTYTDSLLQEYDPETTEVMMYCTGGIRCEYYSSYLLHRGFKKVFQLQGGIINYGEKEGTKHWLGKLFVFDDRLVVPISSIEEGSTISSCKYCKVPVDIYYNCAHMDCNELFLCCPSCLEEHKGCCSKKCTQYKRVRPFDKSKHPKPFRKWTAEQKRFLTC